MINWIWLSRDVLLAIQDELITAHGGDFGLRDEGLFDSALARPRNLASYGAPDAAALAASYCVGLAKNHPFIDGNKRIAFVAMELFIEVNGGRLTVDDATATAVMLSVARGDLDESSLAAWIRATDVV